MRWIRRVCVTRARFFPPRDDASNCLRGAGAQSGGEPALTTAVVEIDGVSAQRRIAPRSAEEMGEALHAADQDGQAVAPVGGGTQLELGMPPARLDVVIDTTSLDRVVEYEPADLTITVEAGIRFSRLQSLL